MLGKAEESIRARIGRYHVGAGEEFITKAFHRKFAELLENGERHG